MGETLETMLVDLSRRGADSVDRQVAEALSTHGSFVAERFPGAEHLDQRITALLGFFAMSEADKFPAATRRYRPESPNIYRGFYPLPSEPHWSHNEIFDIGPEPPAGDPGIPGDRAFCEANAWPEREPYTGWRAEMLSVFAELRALALDIMVSLARGLDRAVDPVRAVGEGRNATLRLLHYAPAPPTFELRGYGPQDPAVAEDGRAVIAKAHVDTGLLSIIWQEVPGLQTEDREGRWRDVPRVANTLSVHCGDLVEGLTGGRAVGTRHRVVGCGTDRRSLGLFLEPEFRVEVSPPGGRPPVSYAGHLVNEFPDRFVA